MGLTTTHSKITYCYESRTKEKAAWKRPKYTEISLATWNVQTILKPGTMKEIMEEIGKARVDVVAVQEIRWQGQGRIDKEDFSLSYSGPKERTGRCGQDLL
jgi:hypothetical protein